MTQVTDNQKYGMIEAISHLLQRDYEEIIEVRLLCKAAFIAGRSWHKPALIYRRPGDRGTNQHSFIDELVHGREIFRFGQHGPFESFETRCLGSSVDGLGFRATWPI
jgi:hypothetical protein